MPYGLSMEPNGLTTNTSSRWKDEGGATFDAADAPKMLDDLDSTYARNSTGSAAVLQLPTNGYTKDVTLERFKRVRVCARHRATVGQTFSLFHTGSELATSKIAVGAASGITRVSGPWCTKSSFGVEWAQADIDSLEVKVNGGGGFNDVRVAEMWAEVEIQTRPDAVVTPVLGADGRTMAKAAFTWGYSGYGDTQRKFQVKVFTKAIAEGGGFDVTTSATVHDSGTKTGSYQNYTLPTALTIGAEYYVFVKMATDFNGADWWGAWSDGKPFQVHLATTTVISSPSGTVTNTTRPTINWSVTDPNNDGLGAWAVKVFTDAQYLAAGFNPETSTPTLSGSGPSTFFPQWKATAALPNGTYRAYMKTTSSTYLVTSPWAFSGFVMNVTVPPAPTLTAVADVAGARIGGVLTTNANLLVPQMAEGTSAVAWANVLNATPTAESVVSDWQSRITAIAAGNVTVTNDPLYDTPVVPGVQYSWNLRVTRVNGTVDKSVAGSVVWLDAAKATLSTSAGPAANTFSGVPVNRGGTAAAPVGAAYARLQFTVTAAEAAQAFRINDNMFVIGNVSVGDLGDLAIRRTQGFGPLRTIIEGSADGGVTWRTVFNGTYAGPDIFGWVDEAPTFNKSMQYRAASYTSVPGDEVFSAYGTAGTTLAVGKVWIKNPANSAMNYSFPVQENWLPFSRTRNRQILEGLGSDYPRIIKGKGKGDAFSISILILGDAAMAKFEALIDNGPLLFMTGKGNRLCEISGDVVYAEWLWDAIHNEPEGNAWKATIPLIQVGAA